MANPKKKFNPLKASTNWTKNAAKSFGYVFKNTIEEYNPVIKELISDTKEVTETVFEKVKEFSGPDSEIDLLKFGKNTFNATIKNSLEDIKSGNLYNKQRAEKADGDLLKAMGFDMDMSDFDLDFDNEDWGDTDDDDWGDNEVELAGDEAIIKNDNRNTSATINAMDMVGSKVANSVATATVQSAQYIADSNTASSRVLYNLNQKGFSSVTEAIMAVNNSVVSFAKIGQPITEHINNSATFYTKTTELLGQMNESLNKIVENTTPPQKKEANEPKGLFSDAFGSNGLTVSSLIDLIKESIGGDSDTLNMIKDTIKGGGLTNFSIPGMLVQSAVNKMFTDTLKKSMEQFNESLKYNIGAAVLKGNKKINNTGNMVLDMILGFLDIGIKDPYQGHKTYDTSKYEKGPIQFDGITKKAITDVIPISLMKIYSAITGEPEMRFDYHRGKFIKYGNIKKSIEENKRYYSERYGNKAKDLAEEMMRTESSGLSKEEIKTLSEEISSFYRRAFEESSRDFNFDQITKDKNFFENYKEYGLSKKSQEYLVEALKEGSNFSQFMVERQQERDNYFKELLDRETNGNSIHGYLEDQWGEESEKAHTKSGRFFDEFGHNDLFYLKGIYDILNETTIPKGRNEKKEEPTQKQTTTDQANNNVGINDNNEDGVLESLKSQTQKDKDKKNKKEKDLKAIKDEVTKLKDRYTDNVFGGNSIFSKMGALFQAPANAVAGLINSVTESINQLFWGREGDEKKSIFNIISEKMESGLDKLFKNLFDGKGFREKINEWADKLFGVKGEDGKRKGGKLSEFYNSVGKNLGAAKDWLLNPITGKNNKENTEKSGSGSGLIRYFSGAGENKKDKENDINDKIANAAKKATESKIVQDIVGQVKKDTDSLGGILETLFGNPSDDKKKLTDTIKNVSKKVFGEAKENAGAMGAGAIIGGGVSLLSGAVVGPLFGAAIGAAVGLGIKSGYVQNVLFGDIGVDGKRDGEGILSKAMTDFIYDNVPSMARGAVSGAAGGLLLGSPILGAIAGAAIGYIKSSDKAKNIIFGEIGKDGERKGGLISKKAQQQIKEQYPRMAIGAVAGLIAGPFGIPGNIIFGAGMGYLSASEKFKTWLLGEEDENGKRKGGLLNDLRDKIIDPIQDLIHNTAKRVKGFLTKLGKSVSKIILGGAKRVFYNAKMGKGVFKIFKPLFKLGETVTEKLINIGVNLSGKTIGKINNRMESANLVEGYGVYGVKRDKNGEILRDEKGRKVKGTLNAAERLLLRNEKGYIANGVRGRTARDFDTYLANIEDRDKLLKARKLMKEYDSIGLTNDKKYYTDENGNKLHLNDEGKYVNEDEDIVDQNKVVEHNRKQEIIKELTKHEFTNAAGKSTNLGELVDKLGQRGKIGTFAKLIDTELNDESKFGVEAEKEKREKSFMSIFEKYTVFDQEETKKQTSLLGKILSTILGVFKKDAKFNPNDWQMIKDEEGNIKFVNNETGEELTKEEYAKKNKRNAIEKAIDRHNRKKKNEKNESQSEQQEVMGPHYNNITGKVEKTKTTRDGDIIPDNTDSDTKESQERLATFHNAIAKIPLISSGLSKITDLFSNKNKDEDGEKKEGILSKLFGEGGIIATIGSTIYSKLFGEDGLFPGIGSKLFGEDGIFSKFEPLKEAMEKVSNLFKNFNPVDFIKTNLPLLLVALGFSGKLDDSAKKITKGAYGADKIGYKDDTFEDVNGNEVYQDGNGGYVDANGKPVDSTLVRVRKDSKDSLQTTMIKGTAKGIARGQKTLAGWAVKRSSLGKGAGKIAEKFTQSASKNGKSVAKGLTRAYKAGSGQIAQVAENATNITRNSKEMTKLAMKSSERMIADSMATNLRKIPEIIKKIPVLNRFPGITRAIENMIPKLTKNLGKYMTKAASALGKGVSIAGRTVPYVAIAMAVVDFMDGYEDARTSLRIIDEPTLPQRIVCGLMRMLKNLIPFVGPLIPDELLIDLIVEYVGPVIGITFEDLKAKREKAKEITEKYNDEHGTDYDVSDINKKVLKDYTVTERVGNALKTTASQTIAKGKKFVGNVKEKGVMGALNEEFVSAGNEFKKAYDAEGGGVTAVAAGIGAGFKSILPGVLGDIAKAKGDIWTKALKGDLSGLWSVSLPDFSGGGEDSGIEGVKTAVPGIFSKIIGQIPLLASKLPATIIGAVSWVGHKIWEIIPDKVKAPVVDGLKNIGTNIKNTIFGDPITLWTEHPVDNPDNPLNGIMKALAMGQKVVLTPISIVSWIGRKIFGVTKKVLAPVLDFVVNFGKNTWNAVINSPAELWKKQTVISDDNPLGGLFKVVDLSQKVMLTPISLISYGVKTIGKLAMKFLGGGDDGNKGIIGYFKNLGTMFSGAWSAVKKGDYASYITAIDTVHPEGLLGKMHMFLLKPLLAGVGTIACGIGWVVNKISDVIGSVVDKVNSVIDAVKGPFEKITNKISSIFNSITDWFKGVGDKIGSVAGWIMDKVHWLFGGSGSGLLSGGKSGLSITERLNGALDKANNNAIPGKLNIIDKNKKSSKQNKNNKREIYDITKEGFKILIDKVSVITNFVSSLSSLNKPVQVAISDVMISKNNKSIAEYLSNNMKDIILAINKGKIEAAKTMNVDQAKANLAKLASRFSQSSLPDSIKSSINDKINQANKALDSGNDDVAKHVADYVNQNYGEEDASAAASIADNTNILGGSGSGLFRHLSGAGSKKYSIEKEIAELESEIKYLKKQIKKQKNPIAKSEMQKSLDAKVSKLKQLKAKQKKKIDKVLNVAKKELGYMEKRSYKGINKKKANVPSMKDLEGHKNNNFTKYGKWFETFTNTKYSGDAGYWCSMFANWVFNQAFGKKAKNVIRGPYTASVNDLWKYNLDNKSLKQSPEPGDFIIFKGRGSIYNAKRINSMGRDAYPESHVGIVEKSDGNRVYTIEGNVPQGSKFGDNGVTVGRKSYNYKTDKKITGFGRPKWSAAGSGLDGLLSLISGGGSSNIIDMDIVKQLPHLDLKSIKKIIKTRLKGKNSVVKVSDAEAILKAQEESGISALALLGIATQESGLGTSNIAHRKFNLWGWKATNKNPYANAGSWKNIGNAFKGYAYDLKRLYYNKRKQHTINEIGGHNAEGKKMAYGYAYNDDGSYSTTWAPAIGKIIKGFLNYGLSDVEGKAISKKSMKNNVNSNTGTGNTSTADNLSNVEGTEAPTRSGDYISQISSIFSSTLGKTFGEASGSGSGLSGGSSGFVSQRSSAYSNIPYADSDFAEKGCAPSVASMAASAAGKKLSVSDAISASSGYQNSDGTSMDYFDNALGKVGVSTSPVTSADSAMDSLSKGNSVIMLGRDPSNTTKANSPFGPNGHYVLATGMDSNGNVTVNDPEMSGPTSYPAGNLLNGLTYGESISGAGSKIGKQIKELKKKFKNSKSGPEKTAIQSKIDELKDKKSSDKEKADTVDFFTKKELKKFSKVKTIKEFIKKLKEYKKKETSKHRKKWIDEKIKSLELYPESRKIFVCEDGSIYDDKGVKLTISLDINSIKANRKSEQQKMSANDTLDWKTLYRIIDSMWTLEMGHGNPGKVAKPLKDGAGKNYGMFSFTEKHVMKPFMSWLQKKYPDLAETMPAEVSSSEFDKQWEKAGKENTKAMKQSQTQYVFAHDWMKGIVPNFKKNTGVDLNDGTFTEGDVSLALEAYNWAPAMFISSGGKWGFADRFKDKKKITPKKFLKVLYNKLQERAAQNSTYSSELVARFKKSKANADKLMNRTFKYDGKGISGDDVGSSGDSGTSGSSSSSGSSGDYLSQISSIFSSALGKVFGETESASTETASTETGSSESGDDVVASSDGSWLSSVKKTKKIFAKRKFEYSHPSNPYYVDIKGLGKDGKIDKYHTRPDCSGLVSAMLTDFANKPIGPWASGSFGSSNGTLEKLGFKHVSWKGWDKLQPGDIIANPGSHVEVSGGKGHKVYNGGSTNALAAEGLTNSGHKSYQHVWRYVGDDSKKKDKKKSGVDISTDPRYSKKKDKKDKEKKSGKGSGLFDNIQKVGARTIVSNNKTSIPNRMNYYMSGSGSELDSKKLTEKQIKQIQEIVNTGNRDNIELVFNKYFGFENKTRSSSEESKEKLKLLSKIISAIITMNSKLDNLSKSVEIEQSMYEFFKLFADKLMKLKATEATIANKESDDGGEIDPEFESLLNTLVNLAK